MIPNAPAHAKNRRPPAPPHLRRRLVAACWIAATVLAAALALGLADYLVRYTDRGLRIMATAALVAAAAWATYRWWYLAQSPSTHAAHRRPRSKPASRSSTIRWPAPSSSSANEDDQTAGSAQLRRHVIAEAQTPSRPCRSTK